MNKVYMIGRLTAAPSTRSTQNGILVGSFNMAVNRRSNREITDYFNVITWRAVAENCAKYLVKGQRVAVVGELQTRSYEDKDGVKRFVTEIQADDVEFLDKPSASLGDNVVTPTVKTSESEAQLFSEMTAADEEDLPF